MDGLVLGPELLGILFLVAMFAGFIDSIAGGGGLLTVPALLAVGVPPTQALATNKLQSVDIAQAVLTRKMIDMELYDLAKVFFAA